jgi:hypothetical protein
VPEVLLDRKVEALRQMVVAKVQAGEIDATLLELAGRLEMLELSGEAQPLVEVLVTLYIRLRPYA